ncbi:MAG: hypothetical protein LUQ25_07780 [Methanoregulaceae archaeon]|nr:hypothetical protein [Methanoregulaceae archaeon]
MKRFHLTGSAIIAVSVLIALSGCAVADIPVNATPETQGITVTTNINCQGTVMASDSLTWQQSSDALNSPPLEASTVESDGTVTGSGEVQYTAGYTENTMAVEGVTSYTKTTSLDSANKIADKNNIAANKIVTFIAASEQGRMVSTEDILVDGAGAATSSGDNILCPFGSTDSGTFPPFCNIVQTGSSVDLTLGSVSTSASERFVSDTADVPISQAYSISVKGVSTSDGTVDAIGSASAYMKAHLQDGRTLNTSADEGGISYSQVKAEDISYSNSVSASGIIAAFSQSYTYQSGIRRV